MKISVSLTQADVGFLDDYAHNHAGVESRSAAIQEAITLLRESQLEADYAEAWQEWAGSADSADWEPTAADGIGAGAGAGEQAHATR